MKELFYISNLLAAFNSIGLFALLFFRKKNSISNIALSTILVIPGIYCISSLLIISGKQTGDFPYIFFFAQSIAAFFPTAVYLFTFTLLGKKTPGLNPVLITSIIVAIIPIYYFIQFTHLSVLEKDLFFERLNLGQYPNSIELYNVIFYSFQQLIFIWLMKVCYNFKRKSKNVLSNITETKVDYLLLLLWIFFGANLILLIVSLLFDVLIVEYIIVPITFIIIHISTLTISFKNSAILTKEEFEDNFSKNNRVTLDNTSLKKKKTLSDNELSRIKEKIVNELQTIYKNKDISLVKMSELLDIPTYKLSAAINEKMNTTFYDLINSKRIDASLDLLKNNKQFTIEAIALDVGFKSKSAFYRAFKKYKGTTPTNFISEA